MASEPEGQRHGEAHHGSNSTFHHITFRWIPKP
jgi:hypothetical protein